MYQDIGIRVTVLGAAQFKRDINSINSSINTLTNEFSRAIGVGPGLSNMLNNVGASLINVGATLTRSVTLPLIAATSALTGYGISFEQAFTGVTKTVDGLSDEFGNLTAEGVIMRNMIRQLALEMPVAQNEIAKVTQVAGQLGVTGVDNLIAFTKEALKLGIATDFSAEEAATSFARLGNIVGIRSEDMGKFITQAGNAVVELGNNFAATEPEIIAVALRMAGAAKAVGILTPQILGISTALAALGVPAELGGTAVSRIFLNMQTMANSFTGDAKDATDQMKAFADVTGLTVSAFIDMIKVDPDQAFLRIIEGLGNMNEEGTLTLDVLKALDLDTIRTIDVLNRLGPNIDLVKDAMGASNKQWSEQTALQMEYSKFASTTLSKIKVMRNAFYDLGITLFDIVKPGLETVIGLITDFATTISTKLRTNNKFQKDLLALVAGLIALGPALTGIGTILRLVAPLFATFTFLFANPLLLAGLAAIAAAGIAIQQNWFGIGDLFGAIIDSIGGLVSSFLSFEVGLTSINDIFKVFIDALKRGDFEMALFALQKGWEFFVIWFDTTGLPMLKAAWLKIRPLIESTISQIADAFWKWIKETVVPNVLEQLGVLLDNIGTFIEDNAPVLVDKLKEWAKAFWKWVEDSFPTWLEKAEGFITDVQGWISDNVPVLIDKLQGWVNAFVDWVGDIWNGSGGSEGVLAKLSAFSGELAKWLTERAVEYHMKFISEWLPAFINWVGQVGPQVFFKLGLFSASLLKMLMIDLPAQIVIAAWNMGKAIVDGVISGLREKWPEIVNFLYDNIKAIPYIGDKILSITGIKPMGTPVGTTVNPRIQTTGSTGGTTLKAVQSPLAAAVSQATGSTVISNKNSSVNTTNNNNNFAPTINGSWNTVSDIGKSVYDSWLASQAVG